DDAHLADRLPHRPRPVHLRRRGAARLRVRALGRRHHRDVLLGVRGGADRRRLGKLARAPREGKKGRRQGLSGCNNIGISGGGGGMTELKTLIEEIPKYQPGADLDVLARAYQFSAASHEGQQRASGEPYLSHPLAVANLLVDFKMDVTTVTAGLLHDVLEDTTATKADLEREFGKEIAELVDGVTKIGKLAFSSREERQAENFRKMLVAMARDLRVLMIKLAERLHNMRTLDYLPPDKAKKIAQETLDIYAPLAHRLGMAKVKAELEDLGLRTLNPADYVDLQKRVAKRRLEREADINQVIAILQRKLSEVGIDSQIRGRPKHFYSIWKKMHDQGREFDEIYDLTAVRVLTASVRDCYGALGVIHSLWKPVPGRFKDFIAMPKVNMYQSLHTTVIGPKGDPVEIQ